jgi:hypothetical protein
MLAQFGERGVAEATLIQGEYTIMSSAINKVPAPSPAATAN